MSAGHSRDTCACPKGPSPSVARPATPSPDSPFLTGSPGRVFIATALPMTIVMAMNGLLSIADAVFLGRFVGADAMAAVSLAFPVIMLAIALSTLVSGGMSSLLARHLGAGERAEAEALFARTHGLSLCVSLALIAAFFTVGPRLVAVTAAEAPPVADMARIYLAITILGTPVQFLLAVHADTWRNEGRAGLVAALSVVVTLANIALNALLVIGLGLGVAGAAAGTVLAQALGLALLVGLRLRGSHPVRLAALWRNRWHGGWSRILALGAPVSLGFVGIALVSATAIAAVRASAGDDTAAVIAAYGIVTRLFGFAFLPLMALALSTQSIVGANAGARQHRRCDQVLRLALAIALAYCLGLEALCLGNADAVGGFFVGDRQVIGLTGAILRPMAGLYVLTGPVLVLAFYFQGVGQPLRAAALTLVKPFLLVPVLITALATFQGSAAIWYAFPLADAAVGLVAAAILVDAWRRTPTTGGFGLATQGRAA